MLSNAADQLTGDAGKPWDKSLLIKGIYGSIKRTCEVNVWAGGYIDYGTIQERIYRVCSSNFFLGLKNGEKPVFARICGLFAESQYYRILS